MLLAYGCWHSEVSTSVVLQSLKSFSMPAYQRHMQQLRRRRHKQQLQRLALPLTAATRGTAAARRATWCSAALVRAQRLSRSQARRALAGRPAGGSGRLSIISSAARQCAARRPSGGTHANRPRA